MAKGSQLEDPQAIELFRGQIVRTAEEMERLWGMITQAISKEIANNLQAKQSLRRKEAELRELLALARQELQRCMEDSEEREDCEHFRYEVEEAQSWVREAEGRAAQAHSLYRRSLTFQEEFLRLKPRYFHFVGPHREAAQDVLRKKLAGVAEYMQAPPPVPGDSAHPLQILGANLQAAIRKKFADGPKELLLPTILIAILDSAGNPWKLVKSLGTVFVLINFLAPAAQFLVAYQFVSQWLTIAGAIQAGTLGPGMLLRGVLSFWEFASVINGALGLKGRAPAEHREFFLDCGYRVEAAVSGTIMYAKPRPALLAMEYANVLPQRSRTSAQVKDLQARTLADLPDYKVARQTERVTQPPQSVGIGVDPARCWLLLEPEIAAAIQPNEKIAIAYRSALKEISTGTPIEDLPPETQEIYLQYARPGPQRGIQLDRFGLSHYCTGGYELLVTAQAHQLPMHAWITDYPQGKIPVEEKEPKRNAEEGPHLPVESAIEVTQRGNVYHVAVQAFGDISVKYSIVAKIDSSQARILDGGSLNHIRPPELKLATLRVIEAAALTAKSPGLSFSLPVSDLKFYLDHGYAIRDRANNQAHVFKSYASLIAGELSGYGGTQWHKDEKLDQRVKESHNKFNHFQTLYRQHKFCSSEAKKEWSIDPSLIYIPDLGENFWRHHGGTKESYDELAEKYRRALQAVREGIRPEDLPHDLLRPYRLFRSEEQSEVIRLNKYGGYYSVESGRHRVALAQEHQLPINAEVIEWWEGECP